MRVKVRVVTYVFHSARYLNTSDGSQLRFRVKVRVVTYLFHLAATGFRIKVMVEG